MFSILALTQVLSLSRAMPCVSPILSDSIEHPSISAKHTIHDHFPSSNRNLSEIDDPLAWGDSIQEDPCNLHRIYFQNIDGIRNDSDEIDLYISSMAQFHIGTFCWADPGLDFSQSHLRQKLKGPLRSYFTAYKSAFSSSVLPRDSSLPQSGYQPGGTFMTTTNTWATRSIGSQLLDPSGLGRWSGLSYLGKKGKRIAILTAYRSPRQQPNGGFGFFDQQYSLLLSKGVKKPNVRRQFIVDLCIFINNLQHNGFEILLSLDANEILGQDTTYGIQHLLSECALIDLHRLSPEVPPATYKYGKDRTIDFMLGSPNISDSVCRAGYLAYDDGIFSKHRGLFVDVDFHQLMGPMASMMPPQSRQLRSEDQPSVDRYVDAFNKYAADHNLWQRVEDLAIVASSLPTAVCQQQFDAIDRDVTRAMLHAEKLAKRPSGKFAWSPKLREAGLIARYWHLRLRELERHYNLSTPIMAIKTRLSSLNFNVDDDLTSDSSLIRLRWKAALKDLRKVRATASDHRNIHLQTTLTQYENMESSSAVKEKIQRIKRLINIESMRKPFRHVHAALTSSHGKGISKLFVPLGIKNQKVAARFTNSDGTIAPEQLIAMAQSDKTSVTYATILDCDTIERELLRYNHDWFRQAKDTPFGHGKLYDLVGYDGLTEEANSIVSGTCIQYLGLPMSRELQVFLEECRRPASVTQISSFITIADFTKTVKEWKETTSTSPSGRHLGHYKTALLDDRITALHVAMLNLPIMHGFAPDRWTHSVTPLIEKDDGKPYLTRLRVIHLFEADYNLFLKLIYGKRMVRNAEKSNALNDQQHGSRPRRMTTDALFLSRLEKDLIRQTKSNSAHMDNDATGCYDRIVTSVGMMACRRLGMTPHATKCHAATLFNMKYAVKHAYGVSDDHYGSTELEPLFGTGQGSGASPAIWLGVAVILLNALDRISHEDDIPGLSFSDPWNELNECWRVGAFVDDTNQGVMDPAGLRTKDELIETLRQAGQTWEKLLHISGGCLNLAKCSWTLQYWEWMNGRPKLQPVAPLDSPLLMTSGQSPEHHIIQRHSNVSAQKSLGVYMNFQGTFELHAKMMKNKFDTLASRLSQSQLTPALSQLFYHSFYIPSVKYSLPVTSMTDLELHKVQSNMTASTLNKLGYNRHYPHAVAFAPHNVFGCGLLDLRIEQGLTHIQALLDYVGTNHKVGRVMLISLRHLQTEAGVAFDLLHRPTVVLPYLTECWLVTLRRFCAAHDITIQCLHNKLPTLARVHDTCLMEQAMTLNFKRQELVDVNLVRTYLQVTTLSDIVSADGRFILSSIWNGQQLSDRRSKIKFARQLQPTPYQRGLWRRLLRSYVVLPIKLPHLRLKCPLGVWITESNMNWSAMMWDETLYRFNPYAHNGGERHISLHFPQHRAHSNGLPASSVFYTSQPDWYAASIPRMAAPTDLTGDDPFRATHSETQFAPIPVAAETFAEWVLQLPPAEQRLISSVSFAECDAEEVLVQYLQLDCTLFIGTDGGKRHHQGSFSWIICSPGKEQLILNAGPVDGWHKCQTSLRSEAAALASVTLYLDELTAFFGLRLHCRFVLYVDSNSAITNVQNLRDLIPKRRFADNADILSTMSAAHPVISRFTLAHVKSHQDDATEFEQLSFPAQLNVLCDTMATNQLTRQRDHAHERSLSCPMIPRTLPVSISYRGQVISSHYVKHLRDEICLARHRIFLQNKYKWSDQSWAAIAWDSFQLCGRRTATLNTSFRSKLVHNWLHLGTRRATQSAAASLNINTCPMCNDLEDFRHLLTCRSPRALRIRYAASAALGKKLADSPGPAALFRAIKQWTSAPDLPVHISPGATFSSLEVEAAIQSQTQIGWDHLFRGFVSSAWGQVHAQDASILSEDRRSLVIPRLAIIIRALQDYSLALWTGRNMILHEHSVHSQSIVHSTLNYEITQIYNLRDSLSDHLRSYFSLPLDARLRQSPRQKQRWLRLVRLASSHASSTGSRQQLISLYFPYVETATHSYHPPSLEMSISSTTASTSSPPTPVRQQATIPSYFTRATVLSAIHDCTPTPLSSPTAGTPISPASPQPSVCTGTLSSLTPQLLV